MKILALGDVVGAEAVEHLKKASEIHFEIENIFVSAMDFERKEAFSRDFIRKHI